MSTQLAESDPQYWEQRPKSRAQFPAMVYRAVRQHGKCVAEEKIVMSAAERAGLDANWHDSPWAALAYQEGLDQDVARAAAEVAHAVRGMSEQAQAEYRQASADSPDHVVDVPKKRGRPKKVTA